uniref:HAT C-terminal dimerisation domain-containing protein n=1 Tax=Panagrolaimus sp. ES5 TaxID=591445 RepID=A0AC34FLK6_9BILA
MNSSFVPAFTSYRNPVNYDTDTSEEQISDDDTSDGEDDHNDSVEIFRTGPTAERDMFHNSNNFSILIDDPAPVSSESPASPEVVWETPEQPRVIRSTFGSTFKVPNKKAKDLNSEEIEKIMLKQKHLDFNHITQQPLPNGYNTLLFQKGRDDIPKKTKYVKCSKCPKIYIKSGGHLNRHQETHKITTTISSALLKQSQDLSSLDAVVLRDFDESEKTIVAKAFAECSVDGLLPFALIDKQSIRHLVVQLVNLGAQRRIAAPPNPTFPCRNTIKNASMKLAESRQQNFILKIDDLFKLCKGAISVDYGERLHDYLCIVLHVIREKGGKLLLSEYIVGFEATDGNKTSEQVWKNIVDALEPIGIAEFMLRQMVGVSDEGSNFIKAFKNNLPSSIRCAAHVFNTCPKRTTKLYAKPISNSKYSFSFMEKECIKDAATLLSNVHQFVNIINRKKNVCEIIGKKLKSHCDTRFLSNLNCLRDLESQMDVLFNSQLTSPPFIGEGEQFLFDEIYSNRRTLHCLIAIFSMFENPVISLQSATEPTLHKVWPMVMDITRKLEQLLTTSDETGRTLAKATLAALERKTSKGFITDLHKTATVLNPSTRKLNGVSTIERQRVYTLIRSKLDLPSRQIHHRPQSSMEVPDEDADELNAYLNSTYTNITSPDFDLLKFWNDRREQFPQLFHIAMKINCIPATSCSPERSFSVMKHLLSDHRSSLGAETVKRIMIGKSFKDFI